MLSLICLTSRVRRGLSSSSTISAATESWLLPVVVVRANGATGDALGSTKAVVVVVTVVYSDKARQNKTFMVEIYEMDSCVCVVLTRIINSARSCEE